MSPEHQDVVEPSPPGRATPRRERLAAAAVALAVLLVLTYANHFDNGFHFDDSHTIVENAWIRNLANAPEFFSNPETFSTLPPNRQYRPLVTLSLAVDYWLGGGLEPFWFHVSTFLWYLAQLVLMFFVTRQVFRSADPERSHEWLALFAVGWYGFHAANAETLNYVIARSDVLSTVAVVGALAIYVSLRGRARYLLLIPLVLGVMVKATAVMLAPILVCYIWLFEKRGSLRAFMRDREALSITAAASAAALITSGLVLSMVPEYVPGGSSRFAYAITQPLVALHYVGNFLLPLRLSADTDWTPITSVLDGWFVLGAGFLLALLLLVRATASVPRTAPIAFGVLWFLLGLAPTSSLVPLAEVLNDHRTFLPYVGLVIAAAWAIHLAIEHGVPQWSAPSRAALLLPLGIVLVGGHAIGAYQRNQVWHDDESLWRDVTVKSPRNGRGLMNYGLALMARGEYDGALDYYTRALELQPRYAFVHINLGVVSNAMGNLDVAEDHFRQAIEYGPDLPESYFYYGRVLRQHGRVAEARSNLERALTLSPGRMDARHEAMGLYQDLEDWTALRRLAAETLELAPDDGPTRAFLAAGEEAVGRLDAAERLARAVPTPENWLNLSLEYYGARRYAESAAAARESLSLRPDYAEAYNNVAAAETELGNWDAAVVAAERAVALNPDFTLARNNLGKARRLLDARQRAQRASDEATLVDLSLFFYDQGAYRETIDIATRALEANPRSAAAYNNICAAHNILEQWDEAVPACEAALEIDPAHELAGNNLALARQRRVDGP